MKIRFSMPAVLLAAAALSATTLFGVQVMRAASGPRHPARSLPTGAAWVSGKPLAQEYAVASGTPVPVVVATPALSPVPVAAPVVTTVPVPAHGRSLGHILMYHYVRTVDNARDPLGFRLSVTPAELDAEVGALKDAGYEFVTVSQLVGGHTGPKVIALTFDDGYEDFYADAVPILKKHGATATTYVITGKIGGPYMTWDQIREIQAAGFEIGAHTVTHSDLSKLTADRQRAEIVGSKQELEAQLGVPVTAFCYPSGKYGPGTPGIVKAAGFTSATTTASGAVYSLNDPFTLKRVRVSPGMGASGVLAEAGK